MSSAYLLDANVLIALTVAEHEHHARASAWAEGVERFALCPVVEGAFLRYFVRIGESVDSGLRILGAVRRLERCEYVADAISYLDADLSHVRGYRQLTDAYLASLAAASGARLATFDQALARDLPKTVTFIP
ncbi:hypothetical protein SAMN04489806_0176 [Paramicrobacterium humi]|uniref:Ribonuclease VapC n=1 Tax=Paramicrobacterium humi TaxID=640635 RepID=A0A1H4ISA3_9MICO|nr:PIN domain-containing protein [Microbacterium humi]SEB36526.1 hypothetical protein SAMN04489806_0176 [Microbacterium humi]